LDCSGTAAERHIREQPVGTIIGCGRNSIVFGRYLFNGLVTMENILDLSAFKYCSRYDMKRLPAGIYDRLGAGVICRGRSRLPVKRSAP